MTVFERIRKLENEHRLYFSRASGWYEFLLRNKIKRSYIIAYYNLDESNRELLSAFKHYLKIRTKGESNHDNNLL